MSDDPDDDGTPPTPTGNDENELGLGPTGGLGDASDPEEQVGELLELFEQSDGEFDPDIGSDGGLYDIEDRETHPLATADASISRARAHTARVGSDASAIGDAIEAAGDALEAVENMDLNPPPISQTRGVLHGVMYAASPVTDELQRYSDPDQLGEELERLSQQSESAGMMQAMLGPGTGDVTGAGMALMEDGTAQSYLTDTVGDVLEDLADQVQQTSRDELVEYLSDLADGAYDLEDAEDALKEYMEEVATFNDGGATPDDLQDTLDTAADVVEEAQQYERDVNEAGQAALSYPVDVTAALVENMTDQEYAMARDQAAQLIRGAAQQAYGDGDDTDELPDDLSDTPFGDGL